MKSSERGRTCVASVESTAVSNFFGHFLIVHCHIIGRIHSYSPADTTSHVQQIIEFSSICFDSFTFCFSTSYFWFAAVLTWLPLFAAGLCCFLSQSRATITTYSRNIHSKMQQRKNVRPFPMLFQELLSPIFHLSFCSFWAPVLKLHV